MKRLLLIPLLTVSLHANATADMVIDIEAIVANAQQLQTMGKQLGVDTEQLANMIQQLQTAKQMYLAMTGAARGGYSISQVNQLRQYLPQEYQQLLNAVQYGNSNQYMQQYQTADLATQTMVKPDSEQGEEFMTMATLRAKSRSEFEEAFTAAQENFGAVNKLIDKLESADTLKDTAEVQARAALLGAVLQNEGNRIQALLALNAAEEKLQQQKAQSNQLRRGFGGAPNGWLNNAINAVPQFKNAAYSFGSDGTPLN
jgi:hypothetical protein